MAEDPRIVVTTEAIIRNMEGFVPNQGIHNVNSPRVRPVIYPVTVNTDTGLGFGNPNLGWYAHHAMPISPGGIGDNPNFVYQVGGGIPENHNLVNRVGGAAAALGGSGQYLNYVSRGGCGVVENPTYVNQAGGGMSQNPSPTGRVGGGHGGSATFDSRSNVGDQASEDGVDDQYPGEKVKFLCSFGGKILRRPSDGLLRYAGGHTRIISVSRDISFQDLVHKMNDVCGKPVVIKYQLPDGELDALVSVSCPEDLENMMEEYEKLVESPSTGSAKLRVFLFPTSEFDPSGLGQFSDLLDSGQRYVDAVNGIPDGVGGGLTRKVSIGSVGSAQNSDGPVGGNDSVDSYTYAQGDGGGVSSPSMSSPRVAASHDSPTSVVYVAPKNVVYAPSMAVGSPTVFTSLPQTFSSLPTERPLAAMGQPYAPLGYDLQKPSGMDYRPATAYMQAYVDPHQQLSSQVGYMSPQGVGISGSIYRYADPPSQLSQQHFMPAVPMSMTTMDPHAAMNTSAGPHVMQPPQTRVDPYHGDNAFKARVVQFPVEQNCHVYQPQSPPQQPTVPLQVGSSCGLMPPSTQHVVLSDGRSFRPQGITPEKPPHLEDCFMCQKALPHAHSDAVVQGQRTCISSTVSDAHLGSQPLNRVVVSGALGEVVCQGSTNQSRPMAQMDHVTSELGRSGFSQDLEFQSEKDRILQKLDVPDNSGVSQGVIGRATDVKSPYGVSHHEDGSPQSSVPHLCHVRQEPIANISVGSDFPPVDTTSSKNLKPLVHESSTEYSGKRSGLFVKEDIPPFWISYDPVRPFEGRVETTHVIPPQVIRSNEPSSSPFYNHQREDVQVTRSQIPGQEMFPTYVKPGTGINPDRNNIMQSGIMPSSSSEVAHFNGSLPLEPNQITKPVMLAISSPCPQPSMGTQHMTSEELLHGKPGSDSDYATYKNISVGKPEAEASGFQSGIVPDAMGCSSRPSSCDTSSSYRGMFGENWEHSPSNSLFSNQDPWTSQHYSQFVHPKANKDGSNEESFITKGELHQPSGNLNNYSCSENFRSNKDKAEECNRQELKSVTEEVPRKASGHLNKDSCTENIQSNKDVADEYIRQELKAVAEGVAAMVLQPPIPSDSYAHGMSETSSEISGRVPDSGAEGHMAAKVEDVKTKLAEKENAGLPLTEGIGRLQIIKNSDLEVLRELGSGTFGTVYHGKWRGSDVAIKRINNRCFSGKPSEQSRMIDDFWNEAINLADLHHPNVVAFYGVVLDGPGDSVATVTEFMVNGSLRHALQRTFDKRKRLLIAMDVAFGMEYLHGKNIVHFDLKSDNLLVNLRDPHRPICKVGDLGLSKVKCNTLISGGVRGTLPWMAPELLNGSSSLVSEKVDVFSFGIVMWELLTGEEPYGDLHYGVIIGGIVSNTLRPPVPESCDPEWRSLMERCWSSDPSERPSFKEISDILRSMSSSLS